MEESFKDINKELKEIKDTQLRMEDNTDNKIKALFDAREVQFNTDESINRQLAEINSTFSQVLGKMNKIEWKMKKDTLFGEVKVK